MVGDFFKTAKALIDAVKLRAGLSSCGFINMSRKISSIERTDYDWSVLGYEREPEEIGEAYSEAVAVINGSNYSNNGYLMFMPNIPLGNKSSFSLTGCPRLSQISEKLNFSTIKTLTIARCPSLTYVKLAAQDGFSFAPTSLDIENNKRLSSLDVSRWDMQDCTTLVLGDGCMLNFDPGILNWNLSKVSKLSIAFNGTCPTHIDLSAHDGKWLLSSLSVLRMIKVPSSVEKIKLCNWGDSITSLHSELINNTQSAFRQCFAKVIDVRGTSFEHCTDFSYLFDTNMSTEEVIGEIDMANASNVNHMFYQMRQNGDLPIRNIQLKNVGISLDLGRCNSMSPESISYLIQNAQPTSGITITLCNRNNYSTSAYNMWLSSKYYSEDLSAIRAKNITIATST